MPAMAIARRVLIGSLLTVSQAHEICESCDVSMSLLQVKHSKQVDEADASASWPLTAPLTSWMPMRIQWLANHGYCGETSFVQAGLLYGQYISQYDVRQMLEQHQSDESDQLLIGSNDEKAAQLLKLDHEEFTPDTDTATFLAWVQKHTQAGHPVVTGFLTNFRDDFFGEAEAELKPGQPEYDHIVTVVDVSGSSMEDYTITFYDHGLWDGGCDPCSGQDANPTGKFTYKVEDISKSREDANVANTAYSLVDSSQNKFGIALLGATGADPSTNCPVMVTTSPNQELPIMEEHSDSRPEASPMKLTVTAYGLSPKGNYVLYQYNDLADIPGPGDDPSASNFKSWKFSAGGKTSMVKTVTIKSSDFAAFRCYVN